jgi:hypothetical protein
MRIIHLARKPLSEGSVAANVLAHGAGALNIDSSRVSYTSEADLALTKMKNPGKGDEKVTSQVYGAGRPQQSVNTSGRWPNNVILQHLDGCRCTGTQKVRSTGAHPAHRGGMGYQGGPMRALGTEGVRRGFGEDGNETIAAWSCAPGCPVADLDGQSGHLHARGNITPTKRGAPVATSFMAGGESPVDPADKGGASRYFKQVGGKAGE